MELVPQRVTVVLEHSSATMGCDDEGQQDDGSWSVVAYLIMDSGERLRTTMHRCKTRTEASSALKEIWSSFGERRSATAAAA
jgi:hypothetical protein